MKILNAHKYYEVGAKNLKEMIRYERDKTEVQRAFK